MKEVTDMPTYEFKCTRCGHQFEIFTSISDREYAECPECGSKQLTQLISNFYVIGVSTSCATCATRECSSCKITEEKPKSESRME